MNASTTTSAFHSSPHRQTLLRWCSTTPPCATASRLPASPSAQPRKLAIARALSRAGVAEIEAGTPAMGQDEIAAIRAIVEAELPLTPIAWCRMRTEDVDAALATGVSMVNLSVPVSRHPDRRKAARQPRQRARHD